MIIDPTDSPGEIGTWQFDPDDPQYAGWRERNKAFDLEYRTKLEDYVRRVARHRYALAESEQSPEDVAQVALAKAAFRWPYVEAMDSPRAWVFQVAYHLVAKAASNRAKRGYPIVRAPLASVGPDDGTDNPVGDPVKDIAVDDPGLVWAESKIVLMNRLGRLPLERRTAVYLFCVEGFRAKEIAEVIGEPPQRVFTHVRGGLTTLRADPTVRGLYYPASDSSKPMFRLPGWPVVAALGLVAVAAVLVCFLGSSAAPWVLAAASAFGIATAVSADVRRRRRHRSRYEAPVKSRPPARENVDDSRQVGPPGRAGHPRDVEIAKSDQGGEDESGEDQ